MSDSHRNRQHVYLFPHGRSVSKELLDEVNETLNTLAFDVTTSTTSTSSWDYDDLQKISTATRNIEVSLMHQIMQFTKRSHMVAAWDRFVNMHGEREARLERHRSTYEQSTRKPSRLLRWVSPLFFNLPLQYLDRTVNYQPWKAFITNLQKDWETSITPLGNIILCTILSREHRLDAHMTAESAFAKRTVSLGMGAFYIAITWVCLAGTGLWTRLLSGFIFAIVSLCILLTVVFDLWSAQSLQDKVPQLFDCFSNPRQTMRSASRSVFGAFSAFGKTRRTTSKSHVRPSYSPKRHGLVQIYGNVPMFYNEHPSSYSDSPEQMHHYSLIRALELKSNFAVLNSSTQIVWYNDLDSYTSSTHQSTLLLSPKTEADAATACEALAEALLPVNETFFTTELLYWVASSGTACQAVNVQGYVSSVSCDTVLPAFCSQSSAIGAAAEPTNKITVYASNLTITGYIRVRSSGPSFRFEGIPYANAPGRFTYSTMYSGNTVLNATAYGPECIQSGVPPPYGSEDYLFLNIYTPYIRQNGTASTEGLKPSDGGNMASRGDVVIVTINYRLSTLGFLALEDGQTNGNFGIADQILALDWVRQYITAFGGDPTRITMFGQSAGAGSVRAMLGSSQTIGKFAAAIPMSNLAGSDYATTYSLYYTISEEVSVAVDPIIEETSCSASDALTCLRDYDAYSLVTLHNVARYNVVDGTIITTDGLILNGTGYVAKVHVMMGNMRDDGAAFIGYPTTTNVTAALAAQYLPTGVANNPLIESYTTGPNVTLDVFNLPAAWGTAPTYPVCEALTTAEYPYGDPSQEYFKCHSGEAMYVWGGLGDLPYRDDQDLLFMQRMVDVWTAFARTYDPNPDAEYLTVRGYNETLAAVNAEAPWEEVTPSNFYTSALRTLQ
ncbi:Alpha/Beta hydrolase protein [Fomitopsis serialis]|uniref:Alpha/Beta hydrolase protein n=1 Tax=Fomitopsis serialis TaxID=139415 RepID=UPI0020073FA4|nr:Alpha/Beta hydrolase protein [Neoantrodia serialis]KAH9933078.1 Alpha/Beta hydrolase protein [Neoantrodia serialis]